MTTIAADPASRRMVADTNTADSDQKWRSHKIRRIAGGLYGVAGDASNEETFLKWIERGSKGRRPKVTEDFSALSLTPDGLFLYDTNMHPMRMDEPFAIGSGAKAARAVMLFGGDIVKAVEIACQVDAGSSLPLEVFDLEETK